MLKFYVISAGLDMMNDAGTATTSGSKSRAPPLQRKIEKMKVLPKTWVSPSNRLIISDQKLKTFTFGIREQNKGTTKPQSQQLKMEFITIRNKLIFFEKEASRLKLSKLLQDSN